jgi:hypothetical protein
MMAPTVVALVRVLILILRHHRHAMHWQDMYWMVTDLAGGVTLFGKVAEAPEQVMWFRKQSGFWSGPEGEDNCVESQAIRKAPDHHTRIE